MRGRDPVQRKIVAPRQLAEILRPVRAGGARVVQCHGCFDIVHPGHIRYLQFARRLADVLVVSLTGDQAVGKGPERPYIPQELRAENLAALEFVDWVVIDPHPSACELLELLRPDVYVKGREYATVSDPRFLRERQTVERYGGRVVFHSGDIVFSSSELMRGRARDGPLEECRLRPFCQRNGLDLGSVNRALDGFADVPVAVVGDLIRLRYVHCDASEAARDAPVLALQQLGAAEYWGGAAALALQLRALGARPWLLAAVAAAGAPGAGPGPLADQFAQAGIDACLLPSRPGPLRRHTFLADQIKLIELTDGAPAPLDSVWEKRARDAVVERLAGVRLLIWCDHGFGMITPGLAPVATREARRRGVSAVAHASGLRGEIGALHGCDLLTLTERQLREAAHDMSSSLPAVAWGVLNRTRGRALIAGLRRRGLIGFDRRRRERRGPPEPERLKSEFVPALAGHCVDWTGAEEALLAVAALVVAGGGTMPMALYLGAAAEGLAAGRAGFEPPTIDELRAWAAGRPELRAESRFYPDPATLADIARLAPPLTMPAPS